MSRRKRLLIVGGAFAALVLVVLGALTWAIGSERGTAWLITTFVGPPAFTVGRIEGTLLAGVALGDVTILVGADRIEARDVEVKLAWSSLLEGAVVIDRFRASTATYSRGAREQASGRQFRLPELPFAVEVRSAEIESLTIESAAERLVLTDLTFAARLADGALVAERVATNLEGTDASGSVALDTHDGMRIGADVAWRRPSGAVPTAGRLSVAGTLPALDVRHELEAPYSVTATGKLWVESPPRVALAVEWPGASIPGREDLGTVRGAATFEGPIDALRFSSEGVLATFDREYAYAATGSIEGLVVHAEPLTLTGPGGSAAIVGDIALDTLEWSAVVDGQGIDPGAYDARFAGAVDVAAELSGQLRRPLRVSAQDTKLMGTLRGFPFAATAAGTFEYPNRWDIEALEISGDADVARVRGTVDERLDLVVAAHVGRLERWWPGLTGAVSLDATLDGAIGAPRIAGAAEAERIELRGYRLEGAKLEGSVEAAPRGAVDLALTAAGVTGRGLDAARVRAGIDGSVDAHSVDIAVEDSRWNAELAAQGGLEGGIWRGTVESADIRERALGEWRLKDAAGVEIGREHAVLAPLCLAQADTEICASFRLTGAVDDEIALSASNFDVRALQPFLPENVALSGVYELSAEVTDLRGAQRGHVALTGGATRVRLTKGAEDVLDQEIESVTLNAALDRGRLDLDFALDGGAAGQVDLDAVVADLRDPDSTVDGTLALEWRDLEALSLLSPDVGSVAGNVRANAEFGGTLAEPELEGRAELTDGAIEIPTWALTIDDIAATAVTVDGTLLEYSGVGLVAGNALHLTGSTELDPARNWPTRLKITGEELEIVRRADAQVWASPDLDVDVALPNIAVRGTVHIPRAVIALEQLPAQAIRPSPDAVVRGVLQTSPPRPLHVVADVRVTLGDDIRYNAAGLQTEVEGELGLHYQSGLTPTAQGSLRLDGTYNAYGQVLDLERGELLFTGPLDDPAVDVRAVREIGDTTVGVQLTGALKAPATRIYSEPAMSEADALSYLLLGRPLSGTGEEETATLESAAVAMGLQQALPAVQRIGTSLGLDELSIQTTDTDTGAVTAGKYLSSRLYVRYSYGLFTRIGGLLVRFSFNDRLSVEARSGDEDSVDLLYTVEKN